MAQVLGMVTAEHGAQALDRAPDASEAILYGSARVNNRPAARKIQAGSPIMDGTCPAPVLRPALEIRHSPAQFRLSWLILRAVALVPQANRRYGRAVLMFIPAPPSH